MEMSLPREYLDGLSPEQQTEVLKEFAKAMGGAAEAAAWSYGFIFVALCFALGIGAYAFFKYGIKHL